MSKFITQTLDENLSILVISESEYIVSLLHQALEKQGFQTIWKKTTTLSFSPQEAYYKIIWIEDVQNIEENTLEMLKNTLLQRDENIICSFHHPFKTEQEEFTSLQNLLLQLYEWIQENTSWGLLTFKDVIDPQIFSVVQQTILGFLQSRCIPFFSKPLRVVSFQSVVHTLAKHVSPLQQKDRVLIQGENSIYSEEMQDAIVYALKRVSLNHNFQIVDFELSYFQLYKKKVNAEQRHSIYELIHSLFSVYQDDFISLFLPKPERNEEEKQDEVIQKNNEKVIVYAKNSKEGVQKQSKKDVIIPPVVAPTIFKKQQTMPQKLDIPSPLFIQRAVTHDSVKKKNKGNTSSKQVDKKIANLFSEVVDFSKTPSKKKRKQNTTKKKNMKRYGFVFYVFGGVFMGLLFLASAFLISIKITTSQLIGVTKTQTYDQFEKIEKRSNIIKPLLQAQVNTYSLLPFSFFQNKQLLFYGVDTALDLQKNVLMSQGFWNTVFVHIFQKGQVDKGFYTKLHTNLGELYKKLSEVEVKIESLQNMPLSKQKRELFTTYIQNLVSKRKQILIAQQLVSIAPEIFGNESQVRYALVLQNEQELRPTGGFLSAVAVVTFENGEFLDMQVYDVYTLDEMVQGAVEPPQEIKDLLGETNWYLHDVNWDPDFSQTAQKIQWYIQKATGKSVDGVIALNLRFLEKSLQTLGEIYLEEFDETITYKNLYNRVELHSETPLVQKEYKDFLSTLFKEVLTNVFSQENSLSLFSSYFLLSQQSDISFYSDNKQVFSTFQNLGWTGEVVSPPCPKQFINTNCFVDSLYQVDANVGVNKANHTIDRSLLHTIELQEDKVVHMRKIEYQNTSSSHAWPSGTYKSYTRFLLPKNAIVQKVLVDEKEVSSYNEYTNKNNKILGVLFEVPIQTKRSVQITYTQQKDVKKPFTYAFFHQRQPGTGETPTSIVIQNKTPLSPTLIAPQVELSGNSIVFSSHGMESEFVAVKFE